MSLKKCSIKLDHYSQLITIKKNKVKKSKKRLNLSCLLISTFIFLSCSDKNIEPSEHTINARNKLKIYGFSHCVYEQFKHDTNSSTNIVFSDLLIAGSSYHYMGTGMHTIRQNENTLEVIHDPYKATEDYFLKIYPSIKSTSKRTGKPVVFLNCFLVSKPKCN